LIGLALRLADRVIVLARTERDSILADHGIAAHKVAVVPNCADAAPRPARKTLREERKLNLGFMGRLDFEKGLREIVSALTELKNELRFTFHVAGAGSAESEFLELCQSWIPGRFAFHGVVAGEARHRMLSDADIFLLPSRFEGMPNSLLEFMGQGAVPIVTRVGAVGDVVVHEQNGLFVEARDAAALADAIRRLRNDPKLFEELSKNASQTIRDRYSPARHIEAINAVYRGLR
jgi:glycosyltransferase involved in cell wall biosynthesis